MAYNFEIRYFNLHINTHTYILFYTRTFVALIRVYKRHKLISNVEGNIVAAVIK